MRTFALEKGMDCAGYGYQDFQENASYDGGSLFVCL